MSDYVRPELLVSADWLAAHLDDPNVRVVDLRWTPYPLGPSGRELYLRSHIPGAVYVDWSLDLTDLASPIRGKLADAGRFANLMSRLGIDNETHVVAYDDASGPFATRLWWALSYYGHTQVQVLDGGLTGWIRENREVASGTAYHGARIYRANPRPELRADLATVRAALDRGDATIVDVRPAAQYHGLDSGGALRGGHIPGAINVPIAANYRPDEPTFRSGAELRALYETAGVSPDRRVITTCNAGVGSAGALFALNLIGYDNVSLYDGSWCEWGNDPDLPVEP